MNKILFSSNKDDWETPHELFNKLDQEFHFTIDVCANYDNKKCNRYYSKKDNGLLQDWTNETVWCNPPYGRKISEWVKKAKESNATVVMLLPARTDTKWFHKYIYGRAEIRFIKGRLKFVGSKNSAPFPSMIVIFKKHRKMNILERTDTNVGDIEKDRTEKFIKACKELEEYICIAPNLDEMSATKYLNIQREAYVRGRAEEQQKAEEIINNNYISKQKVKDKIEEINKEYEDSKDENGNSEYYYPDYTIRKLEELLEEK